MDMFRSNHKSGVISCPIGSSGGAVMNRNINHKTSTDQIKRICIWNVRTMAQARKIECAIKELERMKISIMGVSEMRWTDLSYYDVDEHRVYYSGSMNDKYKNGVEMLVHRSVVKYVRNFVPVNDRILLIQINASPVNTNIIQVYAPTTDHSDEEMQEFYNQIHNTIKNLSKHELLHINGRYQRKDR